MSLKRFVRAAPAEYGAYGIYRYSGQTGILGAGIANDSEIFQFRWNPSDAAMRAIINRIRISAAVSTTFFAAGVPVLAEVVRATAWSAVGTGGTGLDPATGIMKLKTDMPTTKLIASDMRIATTAALGAGTKTLDGYALAGAVAGGPVTASLDGTIFPPTDLWKPDVTNGEHPLELEATEGFVVRVRAPATGTWTVNVGIEWVETKQYPYGRTPGA